MLVSHNILVKAKNFLVFQGVVEDIGSQSHTQPPLSLASEIGTCLLLVLQWNQELTLPKFNMICLDSKPSCCNLVLGTCLYLVAWVCLTLG